MTGLPHRGIGLSLVSCSLIQMNDAADCIIVQGGRGGIACAPLRGLECDLGAQGHAAGHCRQAAGIKA